jgi:Hsp20/alpha crystallin family protein
MTPSRVPPSHRHAVLTAFPHARTDLWRGMGASPKERAHYVRRERRRGSFSRSMALPAGVDASKIAATARDGVVEVTIPLPTGANRERITITPETA